MVDSQLVRTRSHATVLALELVPLEYVPSTERNMSLGQAVKAGQSYHFGSTDQLLG